jgi:uncharacterized protein YdeI (YjbR/CyaY-like superfamily)
MNPKVDKYFGRLDKWEDELEKLRMIILDCDLTEELKWGVPCYTFQGKNVLAIGGFKESCVLSFFNGALLGDADRIMVKPGVNTQTVRIVRFTGVREMVKLEPVLKSYIYEAIEVERAGLKVKLKKPPAPDIPEEFQRVLDKRSVLKTAFYGLTPGRQRAYLLYFSAAKQSKTREARVKKCLRHILEGRGLESFHTMKK